MINSYEFVIAFAFYYGILILHKICLLELRLGENEKIDKL